MKRLLSSVCIALIVSLTISWYFYFNLSKVAPRLKTQLTEIMDFLDTDTVNYDIIFIGNSRVYVHIDPMIIDSICSVNSRCIAIDGSTIVQQLYILKKYLLNHPAPKVIILGIDYVTLNSSYLPPNYPDYYYYLNDTLFEHLSAEANYRFKYSWLFEKYDLFIRYSAKTDFQKFGALLSGLFIPKRDSDNFNDISYFIPGSSYKGFIGLNKEWSSAADEELLSKEKLAIEEKGVNFLNEFIQTAKQKTPAVLLIFPPAYKEMEIHFTNTKTLFLTVNEIAVKHNIPFWDYSKDIMCSDKKYFYNAWHLNRTGAEIFSVKLGSDIKKFRENR